MKVLWIRFGAFGDILQSTARARVFKRRFPNAELTMLSRPEYEGILRAQDCYEDLILWDSKREPFGLFRTIREIRRRRFDMLVSVHNAGAAALISLFSGIKERYGYNRNLQWCYQADVWEWFKSVGIEHNLRDTPMIQADTASLHLAESMLAEMPEKKLFCIIGASKQHKFWPIDYWIEFLPHVVANGWGLVINGHGEEEARNAERIISEIGEARVLNLVNKLNFLEMTAVVKSCDAAVGCDSGPLNLAALSGTPTLGLFGATPSKILGFTMPWYYEVQCGCPSAGCWNYKCPKPCMSLLTPEMALDGFNRMVSSEALCRPGECGVIHSAESCRTDKISDKN